MDGRDSPAYSTAYSTDAGHQSVSPTYDEATAYFGPDDAASSTTRLSDIEGSQRPLTLSDDGRIVVDLDRRFSRTLGHFIALPPTDNAHGPAPPSYAKFDEKAHSPLKLNIVIQVVGSRGDVQPFVALGSRLRKDGHRVRLATHPKFEKFVLDSDLEFYPIGGDPEELMAYMVKNPGLIPSMDSIRAGDIKKKRVMIAETLEGCWSSCIRPDLYSGVPFVADAIIANPPSFAHIHCAEALGIPVHIMFTMPWTGTRAFPHPLANLRSTKLQDTEVANYMSYAIVEWMTWQGLSDIINAWRHKVDLEPVPYTEGPMLANTLKIPHTYCWSPSLIPKPADWPVNVDVCGFFFRDAPDYTPEPDLDNFLKSGSAPVYIGFGSIVLDDAKNMSSLILEAVRACGVRAIISRGWSHLDGPADDPDIFWLGDCPHEWLFDHVAAVVHHGGAGTTACGLLNARPTTVVPFFGDQEFWGKMVAAAGAGPTPIHHKKLNAANLTDAIQFCLTEEAKSSAARLAAQMRMEDGVGTAMRSFYKNLPLDMMQCDLLPSEPAVWTLKPKKAKPLKLSNRAAGILMSELSIKQKEFKPYQPHPILITNRRWDPVTGLASSLIDTSTNMARDATGILWRPGQALARSRSAHPSSRPESSGSGSLATPPLPSSDSARGRPTSTAPSDPSTTPAGMQTPPRDLPITSAPPPPVKLPVGAAMALASGKSLGHFVTAYLDGALVKMPLSVAEGFRTMPGLWGGEVRHYGDVTDVGSGLAVAGTTLYRGFYDGAVDFATLPYKGGKQEGALGVAKGVAMGTGSLITKSGAAMLGTVAYTGQGIGKSIYRAAHRGTGRDVEAMRWDEVRWQAKGEGEGGDGQKTVKEGYSAWVGRGKK